MDFFAGEREILGVWRVLGGRREKVRVQVRESDYWEMRMKDYDFGPVDRVYATMWADQFLGYREIIPYYLLFFYFRIKLLTLIYKNVKKHRELTK